MIIADPNVLMVLFLSDLQLVDQTGDAYSNILFLLVLSHVLLLVHICFPKSLRFYIFSRRQMLSMFMNRICYTLLQIK